MPVIEASDLTKSYGGGSVRALRGVSFSVEQGEVIGLLGPNGAGKTTLMKILTGYLQPDEGGARVAGSDVVDDPLAVQKHLGYLPENAPLYQDMAVQEYLQMMAGLREIPLSAQRSMLSEAIYATGLESYLTRRIGHLSKGYRQRVGIAQAILHKPDLLILDEPTTGLDPTQIVEIRQLIKRLSEHSTVLLSTHILSEVEMTCQRALVIIEGELRADSPIEELNRGGHALIVAVEEEAVDARKVLASIEGVEEVQEHSRKDGYCHWRVTSQDEELGPKVFEALRRTNWRVAEMRPDRRSLESVFRELAGSASTPDSEGLAS